MLCFRYEYAKSKGEFKMNELQRLESELITLAQQDKKTWVSFYKLMKEVQDKELYKETNATFTAWVKSFSIKCGLHESSLWNRLKAGKVYESYQKVQERKGISTAPIDELDVSVDSLVLLDKINKKSEEVGAELVDKVLNKELTREDLRETYKQLGGDQRVATRKAKIDAGEDIEDKSLEDMVTSAAIVKALSKPIWLGNVEYKKSDRFVSAEKRDKYTTFTEFSVQTGTSRKSRRIDLVAVENLTMDEWGINIHGVEIKVSKGDLVNDTKYMEYAESVDYLWLAVPDNLVETALETKAASVGIIVIDKDNNAVISVQATKLTPLSRENTLTNIILKTIQ